MYTFNATLYFCNTFLWMVVLASEHDEQSPLMGLDHTLDVHQKCSYPTGLFAARSPRLISEIQVKPGQTVYNFAAAHL